MRTRLIAGGLAAGAALGAVLMPTAASAAPTAPSIQVVCIPEARVCAGVDGNATQGYVYTFSIKQPPTPLGLSFTVNGLPAGAARRSSPNRTSCRASSGRPAPSSRATGSA
ncbi:hypothetical protein QD712_06250 [Streptomyces acidiscabies]|uniref:hypothetical protein n=1 Tax=Streptomyces acidiscabies TaxID=42234 RepID=UPI0030CC37DF